MDSSYWDLKYVHHPSSMPDPNRMEFPILQGLLDRIRSNKMFSFDEYKIILNLQCGVDQSLGDPAASKALDRNYGMYSIELHGLELESTESNP